MRNSERQEPIDPPAHALPRFALPEVMGRAMSLDEVGEIVQQSVRQMASGLECSRLVAFVHSPHEGLLQGVTTVGFDLPEVRRLRMKLPQFPTAERAIRLRQILTVADACELCDPLPSFLQGEIVLVPLALGDRTIAMLVGQLNPDADPRSAAWRQRADEVAARAALVLELERTAVAYQDEMRLRLETWRVASAILASVPLSVVADQIVEIVADRLREERVGLFLGNASGLTVPVTLRNVSQAYGDAVARLSPQSPIVARARASDIPYHARRVQEDDRIGDELKAHFKREGITSILIAVLRHSNTVTGALAVYPEAGRQFSPGELSVFQSFADQAALAVAFTQLVDRQRELAMIDERNRLAREIHDTVAQSLAGLVLQLETGLIELNAGNYASVHDMLVTASGHAKQALTDTRRAVQGLSAASLDRLSPAQAIEEAVKEFEAQSGIQGQFLLSGDERLLSSEQRAALLRIAQEAMTNARKHSQARRVRVGLQYGTEDVVLLIEDDGAGFDIGGLSAPGPEAGYGLFGMHERARLIGGEVHVESTLNWGTRIQARLPYRAAPPPAAVPETAEEEPPRHEEQETPVQPPARTEASIKVLIVEDHAVTRQGIRAVLETAKDISVVGEASDGEEAVTQARRLQPDVVLMDLQMPGVDGFEGIRRLRIEQPDLPVVILTTFQTDQSVKEGLGAGARGYLLKDAEPAELIAGVRAASRGESLLSPAITSRLSRIASGRADEELLHEREKEVLRLVAQGARNKEIASQLFIAPKTVEYHLSNVYLKLGVSNRTEAVREAIERQLIAPSSPLPK